MTGNNKIWRASLAGLASVAMLATMGVSAANAANAGTDPNVNDNFFSVRVYKADTPYAATWQSKYIYEYGSVFETTDIDDPYAGIDGKVLTGYSYDLAGKNPVSGASATTKLDLNGFDIKGDTKLYAQFAKAYEVTFDVPDATTTSVEVKEGSALDAATYEESNAESVAAAKATANNQVFVGWTLSDHQDSEDLYTNQAITEKTTLHAKFVAKDSKNAARVDFKNAQTGVSTESDPKYTLADQAFPEFRAPSDLKGAEWQVDGKAYDFTKPVANDKLGVDLSLVGVSKATDNVWTVIYHFNGKDDSKVRGVQPTYGNPISGAESWRGNTEAYTTADGKAVEPGTPALTGAEFTGWYQSDNDKAFDFNTPVSAQAEAQNGSKTINLYAGWKTNNIVPVVYYYGYGDPRQSSDYLLPTLAESNTALAERGKAINYQTAGTAIQQPTGIEDYFRTAKDVDYDKYTSRALSAWLSFASDEPITTVTAGTTVYAKWAQAESLLLDANGGNWGGTNHTQYVTKGANQSWDDVVKAPSRDGYRFLGWTESNSHGIVNLAAGKYYDNSSSSWKDLTDGQKLVAAWSPTSVEDVLAYYFRFKLTSINKSADINKVVDAGYTKESATAYVDAWYDLQDDFFAAGLQDGDQAKADAFNALLPKYKAAEALLVKSDVTVKPTVEKVPVYRLYNKYITTGSNHLFTTDESEYNLLVAKGWEGEGVVFDATSDETQVPVYRLYNRYDGSHHYTKDAAERDNLVKLGWTYEKIGFYAPNDGDADLYRLYNQYNGEHLFTTDKAENDKLVAAGWTAEESGLKVYTASK